MISYPRGDLSRTELPHTLYDTSHLSMYLDAGGTKKGKNVALTWY